MNIEKDLEKEDASGSLKPPKPLLIWDRIIKIISPLHVESRGRHFTLPTTPALNHLILGILPVPLDERTDRPYRKIFFIWFSLNVNIFT